MTFIETIAPDRATGLAGELYAADAESFGHLPNLTRAFSLQPGVYAAWKQLNGAIKAGMDLRRYELATLAAAQQLRSSYCALAHGSVLASRFLDHDAVRTLVEDRAGIPEADLAVMALAEKVAGDATAVAQADIDGLRAHGLPDEEILGVILAAAARAFFSKVLDGTGTQADARFAELEPGFRDALTVGRPIADA
jgi:alkylhydroperoxidase family enzyme